ncbi:Acryloyl-CoA reductase electron transfer subunit beta [bacterium HR10]|nr:Acryloyl-CoA reductase electron transfer subunit beta [bacterium HR10]
MKIFTLAEHRDGKLNRATWEAIVAGQRLAAHLNGSVSAVLLGRDVRGLAEELAAKRLREVLVVEDERLAEYTPDGYTAALSEVIRREAPAFVLMSHTYQARDFAPKLAAALGKALISDCLGYRVDDGTVIYTRPIFQGKIHADVRFADDPPYLVTFQAGAFRADEVEAASEPVPIRAISLDLRQVPIRTRPLEVFREAKQAVDLSSAERIVAVGRGIKSEENLALIRRLAEVLNAEIGASRPVCDSGWLPMDRQIGSSGQTVSPKLYLAIGISGAIQHVVGMKGSRTIVAINKDPEAPIFDIADYGIVGDLFEIVPALIKALEQLKE